MKKISFLIIVCVVSVCCAQQISPNPGAPDFLQANELAPAIGSAGYSFPCQVMPYEAVFYPMPSSMYVLIKMGPCGVGGNQFGTYTLTAPLHLQSIHCWIGTSANARFETVSNLQIWIKDQAGVWHMMFDDLCEFDKHQDIVGNKDHVIIFPSPLLIPAGAIINTYRYFGGWIFCGLNSDPVGPNAATATTFDHCATEIHWRLYGTGQ